MQRALSDGGCSQVCRTWSLCCCDQTQGLSGGRPDVKFPAEILWATLRNSRLIFGLQSKWAKACTLRSWLTASFKPPLVAI